jgi:hypothetical protein
MRINIAGAPCLNPPAKMHIDDVVSSMFIGNFIMNKQKVLSAMKFGGVTERHFIDIIPDDFTALISEIAKRGFGLRIYIACDAKGLLTVVFVHTQKGTFEYEDVVNSYTTIDTKTGNIVKISQSVARELRNKYYDPKATSGATKWEELTKVLKKYETKCIVYSSELIREFNAEFDCLASNGINVSDVTLYFGAYPVDEVLTYTDAGGAIQKYNIGGQMALFFSVFYEDATPLSFVRVEADVAAGKSLFFTEKDDYDTGIPCPPATGCDGSDL